MFDCMCTCGRSHSGSVAERPVEKRLLAGVVLAWLAPAIAAPVADRLEDRASKEDCIGAEDRAALAHGDVVGWVEAERADVAECADELAVIGGAQRVAGVLDNVEVVTSWRPRMTVAEIERIAERVGDHDRLGLRRDRFLEAVGAHVVSRDVHIHEYRNEAVLKGRIHGSREPRGAGEHLVPRLERTSFQRVRREGGERQQVGGGSGIGGERVPQAEEGPQLGLKSLVEAAGGEPEIQGAIHQGAHVLGPADLA